MEFDSQFVSPLSYSDILEAQNLIISGNINSPCVKSKLSASLNVDLFFLLECFNETGSFKERGARCALLNLNQNQRERGVIAASAGNHAMALAYQGNLIGVSVKVVMPLTAPPNKILGCNRYNASVLQYGQNLSESKAYALELAKLEGRHYVNGYDDLNVIAGAGTIGLDILEKIPGIEVLIIPVGGAGLIAGVSLAVKTIHPEILIIGVESDHCPSFSEAIKAGHPIPVSTSKTLADGLAVPCVGANSFAIANHFVDKIVIVSEAEIKRAMFELILVDKLIVEGAAAACVAALLFEKVGDLKGKKVGTIISGSNVELTSVLECITNNNGLDQVNSELPAYKVISEEKSEKSINFDNSFKLFTTDQVN